MSNKFKYDEVVNFQYFNEEKYDLKTGRILTLHEKGDGANTTYDIYIESEMNLYEKIPENLIVEIVEEPVEKETLTTDDILHEIDNYRTEKVYKDMNEAISLDREGKEYYCPICHSKAKIIRNDASRKQTECECGYLTHSIYRI